MNVKIIRILVKALFLFSIAFTYGTQYRGNIYNTMFACGLLLLVFESLDILKTQKINKFNVKVMILLVLPFIINLLISSQNMVIDKSRHYNVAFLTIFIVILNILLVRKLLQNVEELEYVFLATSYLWIIINFPLFIMYELGLYGTQSSTFSGLFLNRNNFAISSVVLFSFITIIIFQRKSNKYKNSFLFAKYMLMFFSLVSFSIKGFFGVFIVLIIIFFQSKKINNLIKTLIICFFIIFIIFTMFIDISVFDRIELYIKAFFGDNDTYENANYRISLLSQGLDVAKSNVWTGIGVDNSRYHLFVQSARGADIGKYSHNNFLEIMLNGGVFTLLAYYIPIISIFISAIKSLKKNKYYLIIITSMSLKLFFDATSVTYNNGSIIFMLVFSVYAFFYINKVELREKVGREYVEEC